MCVLSIKVPIRKKYGNLFNDPRNIEKKAKNFNFIYKNQIFIRLK